MVNGESQDSMNCKEQVHSGRQGLKRLQNSQQGRSVCTQREVGLPSAGNSLRSCLQWNSSPDTFMSSTPPAQSTGTNAEQKYVDACFSTCLNWIVQRLVYVYPYMLSIGYLLCFCFIWKAEKKRNKQMTIEMFFSIQSLAKWLQQAGLGWAKGKNSTQVSYAGVRNPSCWVISGNSNNVL